MGMTTHIKAFQPSDNPNFKAHKEIAELCLKANISLPTETAAFFGVSPTAGYLEMIEEALEVPLKQGVHYDEIQEDMTEGFIVDINKLPKGVNIIKFINSY